MRKASRRILLIWDILLLPVVLSITLLLIRSLSFGSHFYESIDRIVTICEELSAGFIFIFGSLSIWFIPQIITLVLLIWNVRSTFCDWESPPATKDIILCVLLSGFAIIGAVCTYFSTYLLYGG